jgi:DnaK suppressor protein
MHSNKAPTSAEEVPVSKPQALAAAAKKAPAKSAKPAASKKSPPAKRPVASKPTAPVKHAAAKSAAKPAVKAAAKPVAKPVAKAAAKVAAKAATKSAGQPVSKPAKPASASQAAPKATPKSTTKPAAQAGAPVAAHKPKVPAPAKAAISPPPPVVAPAKSTPMPSTPTEVKPDAKPATKPPGKSGGKISAAKAAQLAVAPASPPSNRFTDRFAPARPHVRQMAELAETPKINYRADPKLAAAWKTKAGRELTEPELHAMPEAEYMNDKQLDFFRARLQQQRDDLLSNAGETTEHLREDTSIVPDPADRATIEEEHALELRTRDRERKLLKKIAQSLGRLETGDYGFCDETGEPIGLARLIARPTATLSLEAQQRRELKQKMFGD